MVNGASEAGDDLALVNDGSVQRVMLNDVKDGQEGARD